MSNIYTVRPVLAPGEPAGSVFKNSEQTADLLDMRELLSEVARAARNGDCVMIETYNNEQAVVIHQATSHDKP